MMTSQRASSARAAASRRNGAKSRGPKTPGGRARAARNALKHGLRAEKHVVLAQEDAAAFETLAAALSEELAPVGALQAILVGRIARAAWRLERAERLEVEVFALRGFGGASPGLTLIRDGNGTRSIETLMRYRAAALAELTRCLGTLKTLQAEQAKAFAGTALATPGVRSTARPAVVHQAQPPAPDRTPPNEPERRAPPRLAHLVPDQPGPALHETAALWRPNEPEAARGGPAAPWPPAARRDGTSSPPPNEPEPPRRAADGEA